MRSDMVPGAVFPDYELSDHTAKHRKLSELQGPHPLVLVLSRGGLLRLHSQCETANDPSPTAFVQNSLHSPLL